MNKWWHRCEQVGWRLRTPVVDDGGAHPRQPEELGKAKRKEVLLLAEQPQQQPLRAERLVLLRRQQQPHVGRAHLRRVGG